MRTACGRGVYLALTLALLMLALSAESCQPTTSASTSGGAKITITSRSKLVTVPAGAIGGAQADCQAGEVMLSGGYSITTPAYGSSLDQSLPLNRYFVFDDYPSSPTSWTASVLNRAPGDEASSILLNAQVECAAGLSSAPTIVHSFETIRAEAAAQCAGPGLTGGGYHIPRSYIVNRNAVITIIASYGSIGNGGAGSWNVRTDNARGSPLSSTNTTPAQVWVYAVCSALSTTMGASVHVAVPAGPHDQATMNVGSAPCGEGQLLTGAGFALDYGSFASLFVTTSTANYIHTPPEWQMTFYSLPDPGTDSRDNLGGGAKIMPICASTQ